MYFYHLNGMEREYSPGLDPSPAQDHGSLQGPYLIMSIQNEHHQAGSYQEHAKNLFEGEKVVIAK